jgi:hypothetical protein
MTALRLASATSSASGEYPILGQTYQARSDHEQEWLSIRGWLIGMASFLAVAAHPVAVTPMPDLP